MILTVHEEPVPCQHPHTQTMILTVHEEPVPRQHPHADDEEGEAEGGDFCRREAAAAAE